MRSRPLPPSMSQATKVVIGTIAVSALLAVVLVAQTLLAA